MSLKGVRKFKGLRLILVNSKKKYMVFVSIIVRATKYEKECHILNLLLLLFLQINIVSYIKFIKIIIYKLFEGPINGRP